MVVVVLGVIHGGSECDPRGAPTGRPVTPAAHPCYWAPTTQHPLSGLLAQHQHFHLLLQLVRQWLHFNSSSNLLENIHSTTILPLIILREKNSPGFHLEFQEENFQGMYVSFL